MEGEVVIPYLFGALMALEYLYNLARGGRYQSPRDSATSLMLAIPHVAVLSVLPVAWVLLYRVALHAMPWHIPMGWWVWPLGIVAMDFASYWMHRYHHALNITWGIHSVHHSSEEFTITTGARASVAEPFVNVISGAYLILVLPALTGLPVAAAGLGWLVKDIWGFAVHTRNVDKLGPLEWFLATPSHHRVHHGTNAIYDGKNFGFITILWDRVFVTFQPELADEPPIYGTHRPPMSTRRSSPRASQLLRTASRSAVNAATASGRPCSCAGVVWNSAIDHSPGRRDTAVSRWTAWSFGSSLVLPGGTIPAIARTIATSVVTVVTEWIFAT